MLQSIVTLQQLFSGNTGAALFWRTVFGNPLEVVAIAAIVVLAFGLTLSFIVDLSKHNILRATFGALLAYILFAVISTPVFGEEVAKMTAYTVSAYVFFVEGIVKDEAFLSYLQVLGGAIAWIAKTTAEVVKWTLLQSERAFMFTAKTLAEGLEAAYLLSRIAAQNTFFFWSRLQEKLRRQAATAKQTVEAEVSE